MTTCPSIGILELTELDGGELIVIRRPSPRVVIGIGAFAATVALCSAVASTATAGTRNGDTKRNANYQATVLPIPVPDYTNTAPMSSDQMPDPDSISVPR